MIIEKTIELLMQIYKYHRIVPSRHTRVEIGSKYAAVEVASFTHGMFLGLASILPDPPQSQVTNQIELIDSLVEKPVDELVSWSYGPPSLKKAIGIAILNALCQHVLKIKNPYRSLEMDLVDYLKLSKETRVTFIGLIKPLIRQFSNITKNITIIDNNKMLPKDFEGLYFKNEIGQLKESELDTDVLICTGASLVNDSLEDILKLYRKQAVFIAVIGPTASLLPDIFFDHGVNLVGGMTIEDPDPVIKIIQEGGGTKSFKQYGKKYNLINE